MMLGANNLPLPTAGSGRLCITRHEPSARPATRHSTGLACSAADIMSGTQADENNPRRGPALRRASGRSLQPRAKPSASCGCWSPVGAPLPSHGQRCIWACRCCPAAYRPAVLFPKPLVSERLRSAKRAASRSVSRCTLPTPLDRRRPPRHNGRGPISLPSMAPATAWACSWVKRTPGTRPRRGHAITSSDPENHPR